jgi:hypothetical protein
MQVDKRTQPINQDPTIVGGASPLENQTPLAKSSLTVKERLIRAEGGYYLSGEAAKLLGITEPQLEQLRQTDKIIGLPVKDGRHVYPKWQLTKHWFWGYRVIPGLAEVLAAFPGQPVDESRFYARQWSICRISKSFSWIESGENTAGTHSGQRFRRTWCVLTWYSNTRNKVLLPEVAT